MEEADRRPSLRVAALPSAGRYPATDRHTSGDEGPCCSVASKRMAGCLAAVPAGLVARQIEVCATPGSANSPRPRNYLFIPAVRRAARFPIANWRSARASTAGASRRSTPLFNFDVAPAAIARGFDAAFCTGAIV